MLDAHFSQRTAVGVTSVASRAQELPVIHLGKGGEKEHMSPFRQEWQQMNTWSVLLCVASRGW